MIQTIIEATIAVFIVVMAVVALAAAMYNIDE